MTKETILLVGGAGFVGSHVNQMLHRAGYNTLILDDLSRGHAEWVTHGNLIEGSMADVELLNSIFSAHKIAGVMHFAALASVAESLVNPVEYYVTNVSHTIHLLEVMLRHNIDILVFSSSAAIFGVPTQAKITETDACHPISPYGRSKLMVETILQDHQTAYGLHSCCLRYFNAAGGDPYGKIKYRTRTETNVIPRILNSLISNEPIYIYGTDYPTPDGTCVRDYIHLEDIGQAHVTALEKLINGAASSQYNLGNGEGFSVREVIQAAEKVTGRKAHIIESPRRPGDPPILVASSAKAEKELLWKPKYPSLESMITHAWKART